MPSATLPSQEDKDGVRRALPTSRILTAAVARLFIAYPDPTRWSYTHLWGAATLCKDKNRKDSYFIRLVDIQNNRGVLWEQELFKGFQFVRDAPFFYSFETDDCLAALEFVEASEADSFFKKLLYRETITLKGDNKEDHQQQQESVPVPPFVERNTTKHTLPSFHSIRSSLRKRKVDKTAIGGPSAFKHKEHVGFTPGKGFSVQEDQEGSSGIISQLQSMGVSADEISRNKGFIDRFLEDHSAKQQAARPSRPPPPPPLPPHRRPPPPPSGPPMTPQPPKANRPSALHVPATTHHMQPSPPPLPERHPSPVRPTAIHPAPQAAAAPPPPAPPPPPQSAPPIPPSAEDITSVHGTDGRANLMASIRGTGGFGHLKQSGHLRNAEAPVEEGSTSPSQVVEGDIISSLADALKHRKAVMDSDEEEESDDEWD